MGASICLIQVRISIFLFLLLSYLISDFDQICCRFCSLTSAFILDSLAINVAVPLTILTDLNLGKIMSPIIKVLHRLVLTVILLGILGSYFFLHIWENIISKLEKQVLKYRKLRK